MICRSPAGRDPIKMEDKRREGRRGTSGGIFYHTRMQLERYDLKIPVKIVIH
jgi:hypothetical protein